MSNHTRQSFLFQDECRVIIDRALRSSMSNVVTLDSGFRPSRSKVESFWKALSAVPGRMSSHTQQRFPPIQVECRITFDSSFRPCRSNVESHSIAVSVPGRMSSQSRQRVPPFQVECRVKLDSLSSVSHRMSNHVALSAVPGLISSHTRQRFPLLLFECRDTRHRFLLFKIGCRVTLKRYRPFQVECRVTLDSIFRPSSSNIESYSTALSVLPGRLSS